MAICETVDRIKSFNYLTLLEFKSYDAFGKVRWQSQTDTRNSNKFVGAFGIVEDDEDGLTYMRERYYDEEIGRFISRDKITNYSDYKYCGNNAIVNIDILGTFYFKSRGLDMFADAWGPTHSQGFYEDKKGGNIGYFPESERGGGIIADDPKNMGRYIYGDGKHYDDDTMRQAEKILRDSGKWEPDQWTLFHNCNSFADAMRKEYDRLKKLKEEENKKKKTGCSGKK